jgi:hypothetical protein
MPARSILSKHIPHLAAWSVSTVFLSYLGSPRRADGVRPKRAARLILQSRLNRSEVIEQLLLFAAVHESLVGTNRTSRAYLAMSVDGGRPEVADGASNRRLTP